MAKTPPKWRTNTKFLHARRLMKALWQAHYNGVTRPCFRAAGLTFSLRTVNVQPGTFGYISVARVLPSPAYLGQVVVYSGKFLPSKHCRASDVLDIRAVIEHPRRAAEVHARMATTPRCACCGRPLDTADYATGIGPVCLERWGWKT